MQFRVAVVKMRAAFPVPVVVLGRCDIHLSRSRL